ncbi:unnamed protein product [Polarella glacialis]|uniref:Uncharacterized protein n=1 Tax=Polarella glacialis TaxID=89957 RepID=A0A813J084_POLGL|nr:unnamed protein product [Polarella glacialis]
MIFAHVSPFVCSPRHAMCSGAPANNNNKNNKNNHNNNNNSNSASYSEQWVSAAAPRVRQPPGLVNLPTLSADCEWMQDEVAFVQTQKEEEEKCKEPARIPTLDCQVPELVRCAGRGDLAGVRRLLDSGMDANIQETVSCLFRSSHY